MPQQRLIAGRRRFLQSMALGAAAFTTPGLFAEELTRTPRTTEGPFYPDKLPLDTDNDLLIITDDVTPAVGEISHVSGRLLSPAGEPIANALVEIWQCDHNGAYLHSGTGWDNQDSSTVRCDHNGAYLHSGTTNSDRRDAHFQGYGRFLTDRKGQYYFRTIKPVPYPGRTPHIHFAVSQKNQRLLTTQLFVKDHEQNDRDGIFRRLGEAGQKLVEADFAPIPESTIGELAANFDLVLGLTPEEREEGDFRGGPPRRGRRPGPPPGRRRPRG